MALCAATRWRRRLEVELNALTHVLPHAAKAHVERGDSAGHHHAGAGDQLRQGRDCASISERRLNKLVDPATNDDFIVIPHRQRGFDESGFMIVQIHRAVVNDLSSRAMPASVYSIPTSANAEDDAP